MRRALVALRQSLASTAPGAWEGLTIERALRQAAVEEGVPISAFEHSVRGAFGLGGRAEISRSIKRLGQPESLRRIEAAIQMLSVVANAQ